MKHCYCESCCIIFAVVLSSFCSRTDAFVQPTRRGCGLHSQASRSIREAREHHQDDEDGEDLNMQDVLRELINISAGPAIQKSKPSRSLLQDATTDQLSNLVSQMETLLVDLKDDGDGDIGTYDAPYLDADAYTNYRANLNEDGSLNPTRGMPADFKSYGRNLKALIDSKPDIPDSYYTTTDPIDEKVPLLEQLFQTKPRGSHEVDQDLHNQIMAQEEGFNHQSASFQKYLMQTATDSAMGSPGWKDAAYDLKEQRRRQEETEMLLKLEKEMEELEGVLDKEPQEINVIVCSKCRCLLSRSEIESSAKDPICQVCYGEKIAETSDMRFLDAPSTPDWSRGARRYTSSPRGPMPPYAPSSPRTPMAAPSPPLPPPTTSPISSSSSPALRDARVHLPKRRVDIPLTVRSPRTSTNDSDPAAILSPNSPTLSPDESTPSTSTPQQTSEEDDVVLLKRRIMVLDQQVESYKRKVQYAERQAQAARAESARLRKTVSDLQLMLAIANADVGNESDVPLNEDTGETRTQVRSRTSPFEN